MRKDKPVLKTLRVYETPCAEVSFISQAFFFCPAIIPYSELADYQDSDKILGCFLINIDLSCAKTLDFFPQKSNLRDVLPRHSDFIYICFEFG